jgi:hypothetical protein
MIRLPGRRKDGNKHIPCLLSYFLTGEKPRRSQRPQRFNDAMQ